MNRYLGNIPRRWANVSIVIVAVTIAIIFSTRWGNTLPFSGNMPAITDHDNLAYFGRYMIYANEDFTFPIGKIQGLTFPYQSANISRNSVALVAIPLKVLAQFDRSWSSFNYFPVTEILGVGIMAWLSGHYLKLLRVRSILLIWMGMGLSALSPALLYRSSDWFKMTFVVLNFPLYLLFLYSWFRGYRESDDLAALGMAVSYSLAGLVDNYVVYGLYLMSLVGLLFHFARWAIYLGEENTKRLIFFLKSNLIGIVVSLLVLYLLGYVGSSTLQVDSNANVWGSRFGQGWGYGGGFGGGFHVADLLGLIIPPEKSDSIPGYKITGPSAWLTKIGFPLTTANLQDGQYEGFGYVGTVVVLMLLITVSHKIYKLIGTNIADKLTELKFIGWKNVLMNNVLSSSGIIWSMAIVLFILSLGYIVHIGGIRLDYVGTPSLGLALLWPKSLLIRSLGRLIMPLSIVVILYSVKWFESNFVEQIKWKRFVPIFVLIFLFMHLTEISGYLSQSEIYHGNQIIDMFNDKDRELIKKISSDRSAIILSPRLRSSSHWSLIGYSLGYTSRLPISGASVGLGVSPDRRKTYSSDIEAITQGEFDEIVSRYGKVLIAVTDDQVENIIEKSNHSIDIYRLESQDVVLLAPLVNGDR